MTRHFINETVGRRGAPKKQLETYSMKDNQRISFDLFQDDLLAAFAIRPWYRRVNWWGLVGLLAMGLSAVVSGYMLTRVGMAIWWMLEF